MIGPEPRFRHKTPGEPAKSNADLVAKVRLMVTELGFEVATSEEAQQMLILKGKAPTSF